MLRLLLPLFFVGCAESPSDEDAQTGPWPPVFFSFPLADPDAVDEVIGVDHDPVNHDDEGIAAAALCTNYEGNGFPTCYDDHDGTDYLLDGGFDAMDAGSVEILAAADGVVVATVDGNYDRCHATVDGIDCDGFEMLANSVIVEHDGGIQSMYWHMMNGSVAVAVGDEVLCGDVLGLVGSSGISSAPHLHFEVQTLSGHSIDPYAGPESQPESFWIEQGTTGQLPALVCEP